MAVSWWSSTFWAKTVLLLFNWLLCFLCIFSSLAVLTLRLRISKHISRNRDWVRALGMRSLETFGLNKILFIHKTFAVWIRGIWRSKGWQRHVNSSLCQCNHPKKEIPSGIITATLAIVVARTRRESPVWSRCVCVCSVIEVKSFFSFKLLKLSRDGVDLRHWMVESTWVCIACSRVYCTA